MVMTCSFGLLGISISDSEGVIHPRYYHPLPPVPPASKVVPLGPKGTVSSIGVTYPSALPTTPNLLVSKKKKTITNGG